MKKKKTVPLTRRYEKRAKILITDFIMTLSVIVTVGILLLITMGYTLTSHHGTLSLVQNGFVQFGSRPSGATVLVDDKVLSSKTSTELTVAPGRHVMHITKSGYDEWSRGVNIESGKVLWLDYALLLPTEKTTTAIKRYKQPFAASFSSNSQYLLLFLRSPFASMQLLDLKNEKIETKGIPNTGLFSKLDDEEIVHKFTITEWNIDNNKALVEHRYGDKTEWTLLDMRNFKSSVNLTATYKMSFTSVKFMSRDGEDIYVVENNNLRRADTAKKTISAALTDGIAKITVAKPNTVVYLSTPNANGVTGVGVYIENNTKLPAFYSSDAGNILADAGEYYHEDYAVIAQKAQLIVVKGRYAKFSALDLSDESKFKRITLDFDVERLEMSPNKRFVMAINKDKVYSYDLEFDEGTYFQLDGDYSATEATNWLDSYIIYTTKGNNLTIYDFNGENKRAAIDNTRYGFPVALSKDAKYLYSFTVDPASCGINPDPNYVGDCDYPQLTLTRLNMTVKN